MPRRSTWRRSGCSHPTAADDHQPQVRELRQQLGERVDGDPCARGGRAATPTKVGTPAIRRVPVARAVVPTLVVVSRLVPHKRIEVAIDTLAELLPQFPDLRLVIVGRGWWEQPLRRHVDRRGMREHVRFTGFVSESEKAHLYGSAWVSLVPSVMEGWGLVVVEAGALGTPSVGFRDAGGVAESIRDGVTGLLADDPADFAAQVGLLLHDARLRTRLGLQAAEYARSFTWDATVRGFAALVDQADGATAVHRVISRGPSRLRPVVHQRRLDLLGSGLRRGIDSDAGQPGENGRDERCQRDAHPVPPSSGNEPAGRTTAPDVRSLHRGRYLRSRSATPAQSPVVSPPAASNAAAATSAATTAEVGAEYPAQRVAGVAHPARWDLVQAQIGAAVMPDQTRQRSAVDALTGARLDDHPAHPALPSSRAATVPCPSAVCSCAATRAASGSSPRTSTTRSPGRATGRSDETITVRSSQRSIGSSTVRSLFQANRR